MINAPTVRVILAQGETLGLFPCGQHSHSEGMPHEGSGVGMRHSFRMHNIVLSRVPRVSPWANMILPFQGGMGNNLNYCLTP